MKLDMDKIVFESRNEISVLQNALEIAWASEDSNDDEKAIAKEMSALLDAMYISW